MFGNDSIIVSFLKYSNLKFCPCLQYTSWILEPCPTTWSCVNLRNLKPLSSLRPSQEHPSSLSPSHVANELPPLQPGDTELPTALPGAADLPPSEHKPTELHPPHSVTVYVEQVQIPRRSHVATKCVWSAVGREGVSNIHSACLVCLVCHVCRVLPRMLGMNLLAFTR